MKRAIKDALIGTKAVCLHQGAYFTPIWENDTWKVLIF